MQLIAHRVFEDGAPLERLDPRRVAGVDGLELDLRLVDDRLVVDHAPIFRRPSLRDARRGRADNSLDSALAHVRALPQPPRLLLLDVKCVTAAAAAARFAASRDMGAEVLFACWHAGEVDAIRAVLPDARILYCIAPIVAPRAPQWRTEDLYLSNSFPFFWSAATFAPRLGKPNRHNINVKLISRRRGITTLPAAIDGLCVHRLFWTPSLAALAAAEGLAVAVYGLHSAAHAQAATAKAGAFAYAIIGEKPDARREAARRILRRSA